MDALNYIAEQNAGEGPGLQSGLFGSPWFRKVYFFIGVFGFKSLARQLNRWHLK